MALSNDAFGFLESSVDGKENRVKYFKKSAGTAIYQGDVLKLEAAGTVTVAAAGDVMVGVAAQSKSAASTDDIAVYADPDAEFVVQCSAGFTAADVGQNANIVATAGEAATGQSKQALDSATFAATATHQFKILRLAALPGNVVGNYARVVVKPNSHLMSAGTAGI